MPTLFVKPGNRVEHNGTAFEAGEQISGEVSEKEVKALLDAGVVQTQDPQGGESNIDTHAPTEEEIAAAAAAAGGEPKKGLFR